MKVALINPNYDEAYTLLIGIYQKQGVSNKEIEEFYRKRGFSFKLTEDIFSDNTTKYHYQQLYKELNKREIKYLAMQYPTLSVDELKDMFEGNEDIIFISNEENFKKVLEKENYKEYFTDDFGKTFSHVTPK